MIDRLQRLIVAMVRINGIAGAKGFTPDVRSRVGESVRQPPCELQVQRVIGGVIVVAVDVHTRILRTGNEVVIRETGMIQNIDRGDTKFELLGFGDLESLHETHVKTKRGRSTQRVLAECSNLSRLGIHQEGRSAAGRAGAGADRTVAVALREAIA